MDQQTYLSVVIRTRNQAKSLRRVFEALAAQRCSFKWETIVVDNESQDETAELCKRFNARIVSIRRDEFTYGRALNVGIRDARSPLVLICSAHAVPVGSYFLEKSVAPFADPKIAAVRCLIGSDKEQTAEWYKARDIQYASAEEQRTAEVTNEWLHEYPSASCCVIRRSVWQDVPFDEDLESVEDKLWASDVLRRGYKIRSCAEAIFIYNASRGRRDVLVREYRQFRALYRARGYVPLNWSRFLGRVVRTALLTPLVAIRYFVLNVARDASMVIVPWRAKSPLRPGTLWEYSKPRVNR
jgi:rhamnosyltransferase